jgi:hypothetical protein
MFESSSLNLIIIYLFFVPIYILLAGLSFNFYSIKSNSSPIVIENFMKNLHFLGNLVFIGKPPLMNRLLGKEIVGIDLSRARFQRNLTFTVFFIFHILAWIRIFALHDLIEILIWLAFFITSLLTIFFCLRFGRELLIQSDI